MRKCRMRKKSHEGRAPAQAATAAAFSVAASTVKAKSNRGGQPVRKSYSFLFKLRVVEFVRAWETEHAGKKGGNHRAAELFGLARSSTSQWVKARDKIVAGAGKMLGARGRGNIGRLMQRSPRGAQSRYAAAEALVFGKFLAARKKNKAVCGLALKTWMRKAVNDVYVGDLRAAEFKASPGWLNKFKARHHIVTRRRTNKKVVAIEARLPAVQKFHRDLRAFVSLPAVPTTWCTAASPPRPFSAWTSRPSCCSPVGEHARGARHRQGADCDKGRR